MDAPTRADIIDAIHDVRGRVIPLQVPGLDVLLVGRRGDNYVLLLPQGVALTRAERRWLHSWTGHAEACWCANDALSAIEALYHERMEAAAQE